MLVLAHLAIPGPDLYSGQVRELLLQTSVGIVIAILLVATGLVGLLLFAKRRGKDAALLWFSVFVVLYGVRDRDLLRIASFLAPSIPAIFWTYFSAVITHIIVLPFLFFLWEVFPTWRKALRVMVYLQVAITCFNLGADFLLHRPFAFDRANSGLTALIFTAFVIAVFTLSPRTLKTHGIKAGLILFGITVVLNNLALLRAVSLPFNPEPIGFAIFVFTLGSLIASRAVENQERLISLDRELTIARKIQASILPAHLPHTERLQVAARYLPMTAVAGDFYDVLVVDEHRLGIIIADVSGHGVPAALIASMVKMAISAQLPHADNPEMVLAGLNRTLCGKLQAQFVTAAYLYLDLDQHILRYAAAGHPPILYRQAINNTIVGIEENGLPLGMISVATYTFIERPLVSGSRFLLYTDGLPEATNPAGEFFSAERIHAALAQTGGMDAEQASDAVLGSMWRWVGATSTGAAKAPIVAPQDDDLTLLVVDVR